MFLLLLLLLSLTPPSPLATADSCSTSARSTGAQGTVREYTLAELQDLSYTVGYCREHRNNRKAADVYHNFCHEDGTAKPATVLTVSAHQTNKLFDPTNIGM